MGRGRGAFALLPAGAPGSLDPDHQASREETRPGCWALYGPGKDDGDRYEGIRGHHRCCAPIHLRSVAPKEDRGGPLRRHPCLYRLQRVYLTLGDRWTAHDLYSECHGGRGVSTRLAPGEVSEEDLR